MTSLRSLLVSSILATAATAQQAPPPHPMFEGDRVHVIHLTFAQPDWYEILVQNFEQHDPPLLAPAAFDWDGLHLDTIGVRFKGNTSYSGYPSDKKSFKLDINEFVTGQRIHGVDKLNLNNAFHDPSFVREKVFYELAAEVGLAAPRANYAALYVNDVYWGLYYLIEQVDEEFIVSRFGANEAGNLWKGDPRGNLMWQGPNAVEYQDDYELESNEAANDWSQLIDLCDRLNNAPQAGLAGALNPVLDANSALSYLALCNVTVTLDSYLGRSHNLYYYRRDVDGRFAIVPWDANESFGAFPVSFTVQELERLPVQWVQPPVASHPLAVRMWADAGWAQLHRGHMRKLMNGGADPDRLVARMNELRDLVRPYVLGDVKKMYSNAQFEAAMQQDIDVGIAGVAPGLEPFMRHRHAHLSATIGTTPPLQGARINEIATTNNGLVVDEAGESDPWIEIVNAGTSTIDLQGAELRTNLVGANVFTFPSVVLAPGARVLVWCDRDPAQGPLHAPFGFGPVATSVHLVSADAVVDVVQAPALALGDSFARIPDATGIFQRVPAPTPNAPNVLATPPVVFVNEFVASNSTGIVDETGQAEDWVELWNPNAFAVDLTGWHLTDDLANPTRWTFPALTIAPLGYALVWCDSDPNDGPLHATFGLSANGEFIGLSASAAFGDAWVDTHAFPAQTTDVSEGRSPDGGAAWVFFTAPTPLASNATGTGGALVIPYGIGKLTSSSTLPALAWAGTPSATSNDFRVRVVDARPNSVGLLFSGGGRAEAPFVGGTRWVAPPFLRLGIQFLDALGRTEYLVPVAPSAIGTTRCHQFWFRDLMQTDGTGAGLTAALEVRFGP